MIYIYINKEYSLPYLLMRLSFSFKFKTNKKREIEIIKVPIKNS